MTAPSIKPRVSAPTAPRLDAASRRRYTRPTRMLTGVPACGQVDYQHSTERIVLAMSSNGFVLSRTASIPCASYGLVSRGLGFDAHLGWVAIERTEAGSQPHSYFDSVDRRRPISELYVGQLLTTRTEMAL
jgi:hypothetical protein